MAVLPPPEERTKPKPRGISAETNPALLVEGRYGTDDMISIFGQEKMFEYILEVQAKSSLVLSDLYPDVVPPEDAQVIAENANLRMVESQLIRELEQKTGHDVIAINTALEEAVRSVNPRAAAHINKARTSADSTEPAKALQLKRGMEVIADSTENLRDVVLERALEWDSIPHMDQTHLYDALPTFLGRPFAFYAEMLQSGIDVLSFFYHYSLRGKWADATGNHHSALDLGMDGMRIEEEYCRRLGLRHMIAPAQVPGREYLYDIYYALARIAATAGNLANFIRSGRGDDTDIFRFPRGKKGSSAMPHKDRKGGNPTTEENTESMEAILAAAASAAEKVCRMDYARDLSGSAFDRVFLSIGFKCLDYAVRGMAEVVCKIQPNEERCAERVLRSHGVVTSPRFLAYLTDTRRGNAMPRSEAHDIVGALATRAYDEKRSFADVLLEDPEIRSRISEEEIRRMADPLTYTGRSREIIHRAYESFHGKKTLEAAR
ncbi:MAG: hypothetical protein HYW25_02295 [Candidatus Aenigmarchaeota archaeon]|nr:hypothetical protein [Candidatus Aenigmarchaeota archaeon]